MSDKPVSKRVFCSYRGVDAAEVRTFAERMRREHGIDAICDQWDLLAGGDFIQWMERRLDECEAALVFFSSREAKGTWFFEEVATLQYLRTTRGIVVIPVLLDAVPEARLPLFLRRYSPRRVSEAASIADAIRGAVLTPPLEGGQKLQIHRAVLGLENRDDGLALTLELPSREPIVERGVQRKPELSITYAEFLWGTIKVPARGPEEAARASLDAELARLGEQLGAALFPGEIGKALSELVAVKPGERLELVYSSSNTSLLSLPLEAARLADGSIVALSPGVSVSRRLTIPDKSKYRDATYRDRAALAGPLKIVIAVGAPDEGNSSGAMLDLEAELQGILDAVEAAQRDGQAEVKILEVGSLEAIRGALAEDEVHILHLSGHGLPGAILLENEDGEEVCVSAKELVAPLIEAGRAVPIVFLSSCHGGSPTTGEATKERSETTSFALQLLEQGVPAVVAMQTRITDPYASALAREFYKALQPGERVLPSWALARARRALELQRKDAVARNDSTIPHEPEYATASLFVAGAETPLMEPTLERAPFKNPPVHTVEAGAIPRLQLGELVGRRRELRLALRMLRHERANEIGRRAGVVLTGIGGVGKSSITGRAVARLRESGYAVAVTSGPFDFGKICTELGAAAAANPRMAALSAAKILADANAPDDRRIAAVTALLRSERICVVLDNFEDNLTEGGRAFKAEAVKSLVEALLSAAQCGSLMITSRYPIPGLEHHLEAIPVGPLSLAETRKLFQRLPSFRAMAGRDLSQIVRRIGGHPRMLEYLDGVLRHGKAKLSEVEKRLRETAAKAGVDLDEDRSLDEAVAASLQIGAADVFLDTLLEIARAEGDEEVLLQAAVSGIPISPADLARALADGDPPKERVASTRRSIHRLDALSLLTLNEAGSVFVHRWTAETLKQRYKIEEFRERCCRAGRARLEGDGRDPNEALRNLIEGHSFDKAGELAWALLISLERLGRFGAVEILASELRRTFPHDHNKYLGIVASEADAALALGDSDRALATWRQVNERLAELCSLHPDRADFQRDLSVSYERMGDLMLALGQGDQAKAFFEKALQIAERLARSEPDRADFQRDLSVSYNKLGDLMLALGQGDQAKAFFEKDLQIAESLARSEPDRADFQRDLSVSYERMGDLMLALGQGDQAKAFFEKSLLIRERLARSEPDRADFQR
ncbi:MAG: CHAT domain-containing protein, partial [Planctomycetes bacterium]|nr:CHAT domain-containing protein [Planctomycetota bacterium]